MLSLYPTDLNFLFKEGIILTSSISHLTVEFGIIPIIGTPFSPNPYLGDIIYDDISPRYNNYDK